MIEKDMMPIRMVEGEGFKELMNIVQPRYSIPSRSAITRRIEKRYEAKRDSLKEDLQSPDVVAITTDCWTALNTESYITITSHYIDEDWVLKSFVLLTEALPVRHTADNLAEKLRESVEKWALMGRVIACVHDNAKNIVADNRGVDWHSVSCFAHTLQLAINDGFSLFLNRVISAAAKLVSHFNHSSVATKALETKQQQMKLPPHKLIQSCKTRWNSVCDMFERLLEQRWAVTAVLSDRTVTKAQDARILELKDAHWQLIEDVVPTLKALNRKPELPRQSTVPVTVENPTFHAVTYPITFGLINAHLQSEGDAHRVLVEFKTKVRNSLSERMKVDEPEMLSSPAMTACMLDPRHKHLGFLSPEKRALANAKLCSLAANVPYNVPNVTEAITQSVEHSQEEAPAAPAQSAKDSAATAMALILGKNYFSSALTSCETEVKNFLSDSPIGLEMSPVDCCVVCLPVSAVSCVYLCQLCRVVTCVSCVVCLPVSAVLCVYLCQLCRVVTCVSCVVCLPLCCVFTCVSSVVFTCVSCVVCLPVSAVSCVYLCQLCRVVTCVSCVVCLPVSAVLCVYLCQLCCVFTCVSCVV
ncbi:unnamed protein product [Leuciscus chuanchicus]